MPFQRPEYLVFLAFTAFVFFLLPRRFRTLWFLSASLFYYALFSLYYLPVLLAVVGLNFWVGRQLEREARRPLLVSGLAFNFGLLALFKYVDSVASHFFPVLASESVPRLTYLPIGVSFFTFQVSGYLIDVYQRRIAPEPSFLRFSLFISAFPQLVAGPIERTKDLLPQLSNLRRPDGKAVEEGVFRIALGLARKLVVADGLASVASLTFAQRENSLLLYLSMVLFAFQVYSDFAGYCDIAVGSGRLFGLRLSENFRYPFLASNFSDFWRRWHGTLHSWLKDYLYVHASPHLGKTAAVLLVFVVSGAWHGNTWGFVGMGLCYGILYVLLRQLQTSFPYTALKGRLRWVLDRGVVFNAFLLGLIFFRTTDVGDLKSVAAAFLRTPVLNPEVWDVLAFGTPFLLLSLGLDALSVLWVWQPGTWVRRVSQAFPLAIVMFQYSERPLQFVYFVF